MLPSLWSPGRLTQGIFLSLLSSAACVPFRCPLFTRVFFVAGMLLSCLPLSIRAEGRAVAPEATITVFANQKRGSVNRLIFGHNLEASDVLGIFSEIHKPSNDGEGFWDAAKRTFVPEALALIKPIGVGALRYPGGCLAHNFNWKNAVGPLAERPDFQFGIDEYIALCRELKAEPIFTVSDYYGTAEEAAELVEYLNAPADAAHPWAMKRKEWGHAEPYGVRWFELGNESDHGNHNVIPHRVFSPQEYSVWALNYMQKMRAVDPSIKLGVVTVPGNAQNVDVEWNRVVLKKTVPSADFVVVHIYTPEIPNKMPPAQQSNAAAACLAVGDQLGFRLRQYHELIRTLGGRDLPLAVTEYNVGAAQELPFPYRFSFAAGMYSADFIRLCLEPENNVVIANYWQVLNGYWGMVATQPKGVVERAPYPIYTLWGSHIGDTLLKTQLHVTTGEFNGFLGVSPAQGAAYQPMRNGPDIVLPQPLLPAPIIKKDYQVENFGMDGIRLRLDHFQGEIYPNLTKIHQDLPSSEGICYKLSFEALFLNDAPSEGSFGTIGLGMNDLRGYAAVPIALAIQGLEQATDWKTFDGIYHAAPDANGAILLVRLKSKEPVTGTLEIRHLRIQSITQEILPAYPLLTVTASRSADGHSVYLVVFNKSLDRSIPAEINLPDYAFKSVKCSQVTDRPEAIVAAPITEIPIQLAADDDHAVHHLFPPCSMTAFTFSDQVP